MFLSALFYNLKGSVRSVREHAVWCCYGNCTQGLSLICRSILSLWMAIGWHRLIYQLIRSHAVTLKSNIQESESNISWVINIVILEFTCQNF